MKKLGVFIFLLLLLTGCRSTPFDGYAVIDWVDFIKWDGKEYDGIMNGELADHSLIDRKIGEVRFMVADNIHNPGYKIRNGDAAFHEKGTELYAIKGNPHLLAVKSSRAINGYDVYYSRDEVKYRWHFKDMPIDKVNKIGIYLDASGLNKEITILNTPEKIKSFVEILKSSKESPDLEPNTENGDPTHYYIVLYTGEPIAYKYDLSYDGKTYFWHPWGTSILANEIQDYFPVR